MEVFQIIIFPIQLVKRQIFDALGMIKFVSKTGQHTTFQSIVSVCLTVEI